MNSCFLASRSVVVHTWKRNWRKFLPTFNPHLGFSLLFSYKVVSDSLWGHGLQHARLPCPSLFPGICSKSCPLSQWYHPTISSSVVPFSSCLQFFPASGFFPESHFFISGGQNIGASASASVLPVSIQGWFPLGLMHFISLQSKGLSRVFSSTTVPKHQFFGSQPSLWSALPSVHDYWKNWCYLMFFFCCLLCFVLLHLFFCGTPCKVADPPRSGPFLICSFQIPTHIGPGPENLMQKRRKSKVLSGCFGFKYDTLAF